MTSAPSDNLAQLWSARAASFAREHIVIDDMVTLYNGGLPPEFDDYFHKDMHVHIPNMARLAWDDLTTMAGKIFPIFVRPDNDKPKAKNRAEKLEMIGYGYNDAGRRCGGISMRLLMQVLCWWLIGTANAVAMALPNYQKKTPFFTFRDPRSFYPPVGWTPFTQAAPEDCMFAYEISLGELKARYPERKQEISMKLSKVTTSPGWYGSRDTEDYSLVWVGEYYHEDRWSLETLTEPNVILIRSERGDLKHPGVMPVVPISFYSAQSAKGRSMFADQASIQAAMARMFSQKLDFYDRTLYPLIFHTPVSGDSIKMGPYATNEYVTTTGMQPRVDTVAPAHPVDADQTMSFVIGLSRMLNRNPEQFQGAGQADSAKAITELRAGITSTVRDGIWPPIVEAMPKLYEVAAKIDLNVWPNLRRTITGERKNSSFRVPYTPATDLVGRTDTFEVEPGLGLAGYQGTVEILQLLGAESISEDMALEQLEHVREPQAEKRRIFTDRLQKIMFSDLAAKSQLGVLVPGALAEIRRRANEGEDPYDVIEELQRDGKLMVPPQPAAAPVGGVPGQPGLPGAPGLTAPPAGGVPAPNVAALQAMQGRVRR